MDREKNTTANIQEHLILDPRSLLRPVHKAPSGENVLSCSIFKLHCISSPHPADEAGELLNQLLPVGCVRDSGLIVKRGTPLR